jgi:hypothetical protein
MTIAIQSFEKDTVGELVQKYVTLRDALREQDDKHKKKTAPAREMLHSLEAVLLDKLNNIDSNSVKTDCGTVYRTSRKSATIADGDLFRSYVFENSAWDLVDVRANANATADFIEANGSLPPGVNYSVTYTVGVRKS